MAVLFLETDNTLSTASAFLRTLGSNLNGFSTTQLALSSNRTIAFTPSNAENMRGAVIGLACNSLTNVMKDVLVELQFFSGSWATVAGATCTLTASQIANGSTNAGGVWIVYFAFGTPATVTTGAGVWRLQISDSGAAANHWNVRTSDATNPFFVAVGTTALSYTDNTDQVVVGDCTLTLDQNFTFKGALGTGDATRSVCAVLCKKTNPLPAGEANMVWGTAASYTGNLNGYLVQGAHSGFRAGTLNTPITIANKGTLNVIAATSGTATLTGFRHILDASFSPAGRHHIILSGQLPTVRHAIINAPANTGTGSIVTDVSTGWANGDVIFIGGYATKGTGTGTFHTVSSTSTTTVNFTPNLDGSNRVAGNTVARMNGYGFVLTGLVGTTPSMFITQPSIFQISGVQHQYICWTFSGILNGETAAFLDGNQRFLKNSMQGVNAVGPAQSLGNMMIPDIIQLQIDDNDLACIPAPSIQVTAGSSYVYSFKNNNLLRPGISNSAFPVFPVAIGTIEGNDFEMSNVQGTIAGTGGTFKNNKIWGASSGNGAFFLASAINMEWGGNSGNNCDTVYKVQTVTVGCVDTNSSYGTVVANATSDFSFLAGAYGLFTFVNCAMKTGIQNSLVSAQGSHVRVASYDTVANDDRGYLTVGYYQKTGTGLTDTTCRTAGGYAMRLQPTSGTILLQWPNLSSERPIPTGNIQNKTMTVSAWVYINNAAYAAGTKVMPTLNLNYDNGTITSAVATATYGSWQLLSITFTPATTYGQISVWLSGATDAATSNAYFYIDDISVLYPSGYSFNLGALDLWANATPVWPPIATVPMAGSIWDEATSAHTASGSFGELTERTEVKVDDATGLIVSM